jgi:hypothetical protein
MVPAASKSSDGVGDQKSDEHRNRDDTMYKQEVKNETTDVPFSPDRREFGKLALTGAL